MNLKSERRKPVGCIITTSTVRIRKFIHKMKHAKRMILVPEDMYARFEQKQKIESLPLVKNMMNSDREMSDVLQRTDIPDSEKQKLYNANLERYMNLQQQKDSQIPKSSLDNE